MDYLECVRELKKQWANNPDEKTSGCEISELCEISPSITEDLPFPLGNGGLDAGEVARAEYHNTRLGEVDPVERRLKVLFWLLQLYQESGDADMAAQVKTAYYSLRDGNPDVVRLARMGELDESILLKRLVNGQHWLRQEHEKWSADSPDAATDEAFQKALDGWVVMEADLRQRHGYRGCIHGEDLHCPVDAAVTCDFCVGE
ncbi:MAG TPA: hypothetical protein VFA32_02800 [Dehalococcoidia bacterium]|nr:hypothetical protein [Dehalococcoidia bacterium]